MAELSPCQKRGFGTVLVFPNGNFTSSYNRPISPAKHLCDPKCIRFSIESGADSMIGACGHSEELAIWGATNKIRNVQGSKLYVAGVVKPENEPLIKSDATFYCLRCATLMHYAQIAGVNVWSNDKWNYLTTNEAYQTSLQYAQRKITLSRNNA